MFILSAEAYSLHPPYLELLQTQRGKKKHKYTQNTLLFFLFLPVRTLLDQKDEHTHEKAQI